MRSTMARPILLLTGRCLSEVAVMKNCAVSACYSHKGLKTNLILDVDKVFGVLDGLNVSIGDRVLRLDAQ